MKYTVDENISISAYEATITFDTPVSQCRYNEDFIMSLTDLFHDQNLVIEKDNFDDYGLTNIEGPIDEWEEDSFIQNKGILIYFIDTKTLRVKILNRCSSDDGDYGFNAANLYCIFNIADDLEVSIPIATWPKIQRSKYFILSGTGEDPIISGTSGRAIYDVSADKTDGYDFDKDLIITDFDVDSKAENYQYTGYYPSADDYDITSAAEYLGLIINKNYDYESTDTVYLGKNIPTYVNKVSAYYPVDTDFRTFEYLLEPSGSVLIDTSKGISSYIPYTSAEKDVELVFNVNTEQITSAFTASTKCIEITQGLELTGNDCYKNKLYLEFGVTGNIVDE